MTYANFNFVDVYDPPNGYKKAPLVTGNLGGHEHQKNYGNQSKIVYPPVGSI